VSQIKLKIAELSYLSIDLNETLSTAF